METGTEGTTLGALRTLLHEQGATIRYLVAQNSRLEARVSELERRAMWADHRQPHLVMVDRIQ